MDASSVTLSIPAVVALCSTIAAGAFGGAVWIVTAIAAVRDAVQRDFREFSVSVTGELVQLRERVARLEAVRMLPPPEGQ